MAQHMRERGSPTQLLHACVLHASTHSHTMCLLPCVCMVPSSKRATVLDPSGVTPTQKTILLCVCVCQPLAGSLSGTWKPTAGPNFLDRIEAIAPVRAWLVPTDNEPLEGGSVPREVCPVSWCIWVVHARGMAASASGCCSGRSWTISASPG